MSKDLSHIDAVIWDLDNTLYVQHLTLEEEWHRKAAEVAAEEGVVSDLDEAYNIAELSWKLHKSSSYIFQTEYGLDEKLLHHRIHEKLDHAMAEFCTDTEASFRNCHIQNHIIVTHASRHWALRIIDHIGLGDFFPEHRLIALEDVGFSRKSNSRLPTEKALDVLGTDASRTLFVEDMEHNLMIPKEMGLTTALVHHGQEPQKTEHFIDLIEINAPAVFRRLKK